MMSAVTLAKDGPSPTTKLNAFLRRLDWLFALRFLLATLLAWLAAFSFHLDKPYWAVMTVAVVSYPSQGMLIAKFLARVFGTLVGIFMVTIIANLSLSDPWLMSLSLAVWLALCSYAAGGFSGMATYACALCGYTSAIVGFGISIAPSPYNVFFISQARLLEIGVGLIASLVVTFLLPSRLDNRLFWQAVDENRRTMRQLFGMCLRADTQDNLFSRRIYGLLTSLSNTRVLAINSYLSRGNDKVESGGYARHTDQPARIASHLLSLRAMGNEMLSETGVDRDDWSAYCRQLEHWATNESARTPDSLPEPPAGLMSSHIGSYIGQAVDSVLAELTLRPHAPGHERPSNKRSLFGHRYHDYRELALNAIRTFCCVAMGVFFWLGTDWDVGYILPVLIGIACALGAHYPRADKLVWIVLAAAMLAVPTAYTMLFYFFISTAEILPAMLVMSPVLFIAGLGKSLSPISFIFCHIFTIALIYLINFANPMQYDLSHFVNTALGAVFSVLIVALIFTLIPQSADRIKLARMYRALARRFSYELNREAGEDAWTAFIHHVLFDTRIMADSPAKQRVIRLCFLMLTVNGIREAARRQLAGGLYLPGILVDALEHERYDTCLDLTDRIMADAAENERLFWWELRCMLNFLGNSCA
jgi:uncharacterized membrane protein YccC